MTRYLLFLALGGLLLTPACRHRRAAAKQPPAPHFSHEEAEPVSNLPHHEFSEVTPGHRHNH